MTDFEIESERLETIRRMIIARKTYNSGQMRDKKRDIRQYRKYVWLADAHDKFPLEQLQEFQRQENAYNRDFSEQGRLTYLYLSPYFARIDFREDGEEKPERIYIGRHSFSDEAGDEELIYDWRSPLASMFYDYEYGRASYLCPAGEIAGELTLKRQFIIEDGVLESMFDTPVEIQDGILQKLLAQNSTDRMKTIVSTIQREQNRAIRDESSAVLVVSGSAGSGKTSIALHRISYLLYHHRNTLNEDNIIIFSPSDTFNAYISDVLPALGEKGVRQTTFQDFADGMLELRTQTFFEYIEAVLNGAMPEKRRKSIAPKGSAAFAAFIEGYIERISLNGIGFSDILHGGRPVMTAGDIERLFKSQSQRLSVEERLRKGRSVFYEKLEPLRKARIQSLKEQVVEKNGRSYYLTEKQITADARLLWYREFKELEAGYNAKNMLSAVLVYAGILMEYFGEEAAADFESRTAQGEALYEDIAPLILIKCLTGQLPPIPAVRHVVIDEAQDYSFMQLRVLGLMMRYAKFTVLGDVSQTVNSLDRPVDFNHLSAVFACRSVKFIALEKTYRSTIEITGFSGRYLGLSADGCVERHGEPPQVCSSGSEAEKLDFTARFIAHERAAGSTAAIITKTKKDASRLFDRLTDRSGVRLLADSPDSFTKGVLVMPSYLAKGLEFDSVLVADGFDAQRDKNLLYVCCTRALHRLSVIECALRSI